MRVAEPELEEAQASRVVGVDLESLSGEVPIAEEDVARASGRHIYESTTPLREVEREGARAGRERESEDFGAPLEPYA